ncbi:MAG TPA: amidase [Nocardioidaceae bacterium]|nr:amidase [Nocardioidaceae bacterium]
MTELWQLSADDLIVAFRGSDASPVDGLDACLDRIEACDQTVGAFTAVDAARARADAVEQAARYRRGVDVGPLAGVPIAVKELIEVAGLPFTGCSATRSGMKGRRDAPVVATLRDAGAVVVGTTRTHELAWGITTQHETLGGTRNPWRLDRVPGGSSGGSAAAVAYGAVPLALGTDTGGSVRIPAGLCGIVGFKPTYDTFPTQGVLPLSPSLDHVGVLAREVGDVRRALGPSAGTDVVRTPRVGIPTTTAAIALSPAVRDALDAAVDVLDGAIPIALPDPTHAFGVFATIQRAEALAAHRDDLGSWPTRADDYGSDVRWHLERAEALTEDDVASAQATLAELRRETRAALSEVDIVLQPTTAAGASTTTAPDRVTTDGGEVAFRDATLPCTVLHNLVGLPSCSVPAGLDEAGIPVGIQVFGAPGDDRLVLTVADQLRDALRDRLPGWPTAVAE